MKPTRLLLVVVLLSTALAAGYPPYQAKSDRTEVALQAAIKKEMVDGDLKAAIEQYKKIIATRGASRAVVAKALLQLGGCYEKQGNAEARKTFEQLVKDFADQTDVVAQARARLAALATATAAQPSRGGIRLRQVWDGEGIGLPLVSPSPDGRSLIYTPGRLTDLMIHDLGTGSDRLLANLADGSKKENINFPQWSPDGNWIVYVWETADGRAQIRVYDMASKTSRVLLDETNPNEYPWNIFRSNDPNHLLILFRVNRNATDRVYTLRLVTVKTGEFHEIRTFERGGPSFFDLSPDGRFVAYAAPSKRASLDNDLYVVDSDTGKEASHIDHPAAESLLGWTPDGLYLLFQSDRTGTPDIWAQLMNNGKPASEPVLIKSFGEWIKPMGSTSAGIFFYTTNTSGLGPSDVYLTELDFANGLASEPRLISTSHQGTHASVFGFSPDGRYLAYSGVHARSPNPSFNYYLDSDCIHVQSMETGKVTEFPMEFKGLGVTWWRDNQSIIFSSRQGMETILYELDINTGKTGKIRSLPARAADGSPQSLYGSGMEVLIASRSSLPGPIYTSRLAHLDLRAGEEKELPSGTGNNAGFMSPDGQKFVFNHREQTAEGKAKTSWGFGLVQDGTRQVVLTLDAQNAYFALSWAADSGSLIFGSIVGGVTDQLLQVPLDGSPPKRVALKTDGRLMGVAAHPDGKRFAIILRKPGQHEIWAMENFLPPAKDAKQKN